VSGKSTTILEKFQAALPSRGTNNRTTNTRSRLRKQAMAPPATNSMRQLLRRIAQDPQLRELPDDELLRRFQIDRDETAFHALVSGHGPMVFDVCRGVLSAEADVEDAFQATFLILTRKASSIRKSASVAAWLHGVAYRTALKARSQSAARQRHESRAVVRQTAE